MVLRLHQHSIGYTGDGFYCTGQKTQPTILGQKLLLPAYRSLYIKNRFLHKSMTFD